MLTPSTENMEPKNRRLNRLHRRAPLLAGTLTSLESLHEQLTLSKPTLQQREAAEAYPLLVPQAFLERIERGCPHDPLLLQVLPQKEELDTVQGFGSDPVGEVAATRSPGILRKFHGRALIVTTPRCGVHCRFCFRRHLLPRWSDDQVPRWDQWAEEIGQDRSISEVILSGGDPLTRSDEELARGLHLLGGVPHVRRVRIHSRLPVVLPSRVGEGLLSALLAARCTVFMVLHVNHSREIDATVAKGFRRLREAGIPLLAQSVLLRGVNDSAEAMASLCETLADHGVIPYYLHQLDRVAGAAHFEVPPAQGREIIRRLRNILPGYAVPRYVRESAGSPYKAPLAGD